MNIGMLWFDNDQQAELTTKVERAAAYYRDKYGKSPTLCFVHPSMLPNSTSPGKSKARESDIKNKSFVTAGLQVRSTPTVLPNHFWIGINQAHS